MTCRISIRVLFVIAVAILAGAAALPAFAEVREEFHETCPLAATGSFGLTNINGGVRIIGWDRNEVKIDAVKTAVNKEQLDELKIEVKAEPDRVFVDTKYPGDRGRSGKGHSGNTSVDYTVSIPKSASIDKVQLVNGKLAVDDVNGALKATTVNGAIIASHPGGPVDLSTVNGSIEVTLGETGPVKPVELKTVNGSIGLMLPPGAAADVRAATVHGDIKNDFGLTASKGRYTGGRLNGQIGHGGATIRIETVNGPISISKQSKEK